MLSIGALGFSSPLILLALLALPLLWWLLRAIPPAPLRRHFPALMLLLGLKDHSRETHKTPPWLLFLRIFALALALIAFSGPFWRVNPAQQYQTDLPLLLVFDADWASAQNWQDHLSHAQNALTLAAAQNKKAAIVVLSDRPAPVPWQDAATVARQIAQLRPAPLALRDVSGWIDVLLAERFETIWLSGGVNDASRAALYAALAAQGPLRIFQPSSPIYALLPAAFGAEDIQLTAQRIAPILPAAGIGVTAYGAGGRVLLSDEMRFDLGAEQAQLTLTPPLELRNQILRFGLGAAPSAGLLALVDDGLKRRKVALVSTQNMGEGARLLSSDHYLRAAVGARADLVQGSLEVALRTAPDAVVLSDEVNLSPSEHVKLREWVENGGALLRFAGSGVIGAEDALMPVILRVGGRNLDGAMSWDTPKNITPFPKDSPFFGLNIPVDVTVRSQVLAMPDPDLPLRTIAALSDGTPLVTRKALGHGSVVLFHIRATPDWSDLPLSQLFVDMLDRLVIAGKGGVVDLSDIAAMQWRLKEALLSDGRLTPSQSVRVSGDAMRGALAQGASRDVPPGIYHDGGRHLAVNVLPADYRLGAAVWPQGALFEAGDMRVYDLKSALILSAILLFFYDIIAALALSGRLWVLVGAVLFVAPPLWANDDFALRASRELTFAHVITGDARLDAVAQKGLAGMSDILRQRTSVHPAEPMAVDIARDELAFFPLLYWPLSVDQPIPKPEVYDKLNAYLRGGGMILFDTRDGGDAQSQEAAALRYLAAGLSLPDIKKIPRDHVLMRSFYLLRDMPGRYNSPVWIAAPGSLSRVDGVSPVVIGGADWAAAWAAGADGGALVPMPAMQREDAYRFGVNLVMHALSGNYKSDQVHLPALLDRLGAP